MSLTEYAENIFKTVQIDLKAVGSTISSSIDTFVDQQLNNSTNTNGAMEVTLETIKEIALGSAFGMCAGYATKKTGAPVLAGVASTSFLLLRGAIFDGHVQASWSPLAIDDSSFAR